MKNGNELDVVREINHAAAVLKDSAQDLDDTMLCLHSTIREVGVAARNGYSSMQMNCQERMRRCALLMMRWIPSNNSEHGLRVQYKPSKSSLPRLNIGLQRAAPLRPSLST